MTLSLWHRIALPAALIALVLISGMLGVAFTAQKQASETIEQHGNLLLDEQTERFLSSLITGVGGGTDAYLALAEESLALTAEGSGRGESAGLDEMLQRLLQSNDSVVAAFHLSDDGTYRARTHDGSVENSGGELAHLKEGDWRAEDRVDWLEARNSRWGEVEEVVMDAVVTVPVDQGVDLLGLSLSLNDLARRLNKRLPLPGSYFFIMDSSQQLVAAPPHSQLELAGGWSGREHAVADLGQSAPDSLLPALDRMSEGKALLERVSLRDDKRYLTYQPLEHADWRVGLMVPVSVARQVSQEMVEVVGDGSNVALRTMVIWSAVLLVVTVLLSTVLSRRLANPLTHVSQVAESIAGGDLQRRVTVQGYDEVARLGRSFNAMADRLNDFINNLESKVQQRTREADRARLRAQNILESSPVGIAFLNGQAELEDINPALRRLLGWSETGAISQQRLPSSWQDAITEARAALVSEGAFTAVRELERADVAVFTASLQGRMADTEGVEAGFILVVQDISEQKALEAELERQASHDQLTGALNRWKFGAKLHAAIQHSGRYQRPFSVILLDVDHFKLINDEYGHNTGDAVLRALAQAIEFQLRAVDCMARWGGEEFIVLLPETDASQAALFAERIRALVEELRFGEELDLTISLGVAEYRGETTPDELVRRADQVLYQAKNSGRNQVAVSP